MSATPARPDGATVDVDLEDCRRVMRELGRLVADEGRSLRDGRRWWQSARPPLPVGLDARKLDASLRRALLRALDEGYEQRRRQLERLERQAP